MTDEDPGGFTEPDPAPLPTEDQLGEIRLVDGDAKCANCIHFSVCAYYAGIQPMLQKREDAPIDAQDLAVICDEYVPDET